MATRVEAAVGRFVWHDHNSGDAEKAKAFYTGLLDWEVEVWKPGEMDYPMIKSGGQMHGGFAAAQGGAPPHWLAYVVVQSVDDAVSRAERAGGRTLAPPFDVPEVGRIAVLADPQGAVFGVFTPEGEAPPSEGVFVWDELLTSDVEAAKRFYGEVVGWTTSEMDMGDMGVYTLFRRAGDVDAAGCMTLPPGLETPPHWLPYLAAGDIDATAARAAKLGGTTLMEPTDIPGGRRIAVVQDATGAAFGLFKPAG